MCFEDFDPGALLAGPCGHGFCKDCWRGYAVGKVGDGPSVLDVRCLHPDCRAAVRRRPFRSSMVTMQCEPGLTQDRFETGTYHGRPAR